MSAEIKLKTNGVPYRLEALAGGKFRMVTLPMTPEHALAKILSRRNVVLRTMDTPCWEWTGHRMYQGYGHTRFDGKVWRVHRLFWHLTAGPIPDEMFLCHKCDNPPCFNPEHLFVGSNQDNMTDCVEKGRNYAPIGEKHPKATLTEWQVKSIRILVGATNPLRRSTVRLAATLLGSPYQTADAALRRRTWRHLL